MALLNEEEMFQLDTQYKDRSTYPIRWEDAEKIIKNTICPVQKLYFVLGFSCGLRSSDLRGMKWQHIFDFDTYSARKDIFVTENKTKRFNKKRKWISFPEETQAKIKKTVYLLDPKPHEYCWSYYMTPTILPKQMKLAKWVERALERNNIKYEGVPGTHILRKTFVLRVHDIYEKMMPGAGITMAAKIVGHTNVATTMTYLGFTKKHMDSVFKEIFKTIPELKQKRTRQDIKRLKRNGGKKKHYEWPVAGPGEFDEEE